jgi:hypothetical protein
MTQLAMLMKKVQSFLEPFPTVPLQRAQNVCNILDKLILDITKKFPNEDISKKINYSFTYAVIWGIGASFD